MTSFSHSDFSITTLENLEGKHALVTDFLLSVYYEQDPMLATEIMYHRERALGNLIFHPESAKSSSMAVL